MNLTQDDLSRMELTSDRILVLEDPPGSTPSGIQLLSNDHKFDRIVTVMMTGPGIDPIGMPLKKGDRIMIGQHAGITITADLPDEQHGGMMEVEFQLVRLSGVLAVIEEDNTTPGV